MKLEYQLLDSIKSKLSLDESKEVFQKFKPEYVDENKRYYSGTVFLNDIFIKNENVNTSSINTSESSAGALLGDIPKSSSKLKLIIRKILEGDKLEHPPQNLLYTVRAIIGAIVTCSIIYGLFQYWEEHQQNGIDHVRPLHTLWGLIPITQTLIIISLVIIITSAVLFILFSKSIYRIFLLKALRLVDKEKLNLIKENDDVYTVISSTYETLSSFRIERERQARYAYNASLCLIITGIIIVFFGVYFLFRNSITEGMLSSGIGGISSILGGTVLKLYKNTNDRMDKLNQDLFVLRTAMVQYALIIKIQGERDRDKEIKKLIDAVGKLTYKQSFEWEG